MGNSPAAACELWKVPSSQRAQKLLHSCLPTSLPPGRARACLSSTQEEPGLLLGGTVVKEEKMMGEIPKRLALQLHGPQECQGGEKGAELLLVLHGQGAPGAWATPGAVPAAPPGSVRALAAGLHYINCVAL